MISFLFAIVFVEARVFFCLGLQETEGDEEGEGEDEVDDEVEDGENESGAAAETEKAPSKPDVLLPPVFREPERQLSKKEIKKKELADLEAVLAQFAVDQTEEKEEKEENGESPFLSLNRLLNNQLSLRGLFTRSCFQIQNEKFISRTRA